MKLTPMHIHWAVVHHFSADPRAELGSAHFNSPAGCEVQKWLWEEGLVEGSTKATTHGTPRLAAFVEHLCQQPLPVQKWVQPE